MGELLKASRRLWNRSLLWSSHSEPTKQALPPIASTNLAHNQKSMVRQRRKVDFICQRKQVTAMDLGNIGMFAKPADILFDHRRTKHRAAGAEETSDRGSPCGNSISNRKSPLKLLMLKELPYRLGGSTFCGCSVFMSNLVSKFIRKNVRLPDARVRHCSACDVFWWRNIHWLVFGNPTRNEPLLQEIAVTLYIYGSWRVVRVALKCPNSRACWYYWIFGTNCSKTVIFEDKLHSFDILKLPIFTSFLPKYPILVSTNTP